MTVPSAINKSGPYTGNGVTTVFPYGFRILNASHIQVVRTENGIDTVLTTGFTVSGVGAGGGGNVTFSVAPTAAQKITLIRNAPFVQNTDLQNQGAYYAETIEDALDLAVMRDQQMAEQIGRSLRLPASVSNGVDVTLPAPEQNKLIGWNAGGTALQNLDSATLATVVAFGTMNADIFTGNGVQTAFTLSANPGAQANLDVSINGSTLVPGVDYVWTAGLNVTFAVAPGLGDEILCRYSRALPQGAADAAAVTTSYGVMLSRLLALRDGTVAQLLADTSLNPAVVPVGSVIEAGGFRYQVAATGATNHHLTTAAGVKLYVLPPYDVRAFGAVGDGATNDTTAFRLAGLALTADGGGKLVIPAGTYMVGRQTLAGATGQGFAWLPEQMLRVQNCTRPVVIELQGAVIRNVNGLRFGSFDPVTGNPYTPPSLPFYDQNYTGDVGAMLDFQNNSGGVSIVGSGELDGNNINMILGGRWGDTGWQRVSYGIQEYNNAFFYVENLYAHHHGTDGLMMGYVGAVDGGAHTPKTLLNVTSEYNGRQGLSWVGGIGLTAIGCKFNRTGMAINLGAGIPLKSSPASGVDIEAEDAVCRNGVFINCEMVNNAAVAMVADSGDNADVSFIGCQFGGTVWPKMPGFKFDRCKFYGPIANQFASIDPTQATSFEDCEFTDATIQDYTQPAALGANAFVSTPSAPVNYTRCSFNYSRVRPGRLDFANLRDCRFSMRFGTTAVNNQDFAIIMSNATLQGCTFDANITANAPADGFYLDVLGVRSIGNNLLTNTAGVIRWSSWSVGAGGFTGLLGDAGVQSTPKNGRNSLTLFRSNWWNQGLGTIDIYAGTAPPTAGTYKAGDRFLNQSPTVGQPRGWVCTVAGTPGTWVSEGNL